MATCVSRLDGLSYFWRNTLDSAESYSLGLYKSIRVIEFWSPIPAREKVDPGVVTAGKGGPP